MAVSVGDSVATVVSLAFRGPVPLLRIRRHHRRATALARTVHMAILRAPFVRRYRPPLSWSHARDATFRTCARRYYYRYYLAAEAQWPGASRDAAAAASLNQLVALEAALGNVVHARARELVRACRLGLALPELATLERRSRKELNALWVFSRCDREHAPSGPTIGRLLREIRYGEVVEPDRLRRLSARLSRCLTALVEDPVWHELEHLAGSDEVITPDQPESVRVAGVPVYAAPDLAYRPRVGAVASGIAPEWVIVEWKTGVAPADLEQLALYALWLDRRTFPFPNVLGPPETAWYEAHSVGLATGYHECVRIERRDLEGVVSRIQHSAAAMRDLLTDPDRNAPKDRTAFPSTEHPGQCRRCNFLAICDVTPLGVHAKAESEEASAENMP
jgi:hypothetical protein